jgi:hypothetical protein
MAAHKMAWLAFFSMIRFTSALLVPKRVFRRGRGSVEPA